MNPREIDTTRRPVVLVWEVTQACEQACKHCRADSQPKRHPDELTTREGKRLLQDARVFGEDQLVVLSGGDPLAREDTVEFVEYGTDLGLGMTLTPSGTASLTRDRVDGAVTLPTCWSGSDCSARTNTSHSIAPSARSCSPTCARSGFSTMSEIR